MAGACKAMTGYRSLTCERVNTGSLVNARSFQLDSFLDWAIGMTVASTHSSEVSDEIEFKLKPPQSHSIMPSLQLNSYTPGLQHISFESP